MSLKDEFAGLNMASLLGGPLSAATDASSQIANSAVEFINKVGFGENGKTQMMDFGATANSSWNLRIIKVNVTRNASDYGLNTRSPNNSAKYHVNVRPGNNEIPEALARVLDILEADITPLLVESALKDGNELGKYDIYNVSVK